MTLSERIAQIALIIAIVAVCYFIFAYAQGSIQIGNTIVNTGSTLDDGLVAHYTFDGSDMINNVADVSGNGNHGVLNLDVSGNTSTTTVPGVTGQAIEFDGEDDRVRIEGPIVQSGGQNSFSGMAWVKTTDSSGRLWEEVDGGMSFNVFLDQCNLRDNDGIQYWADLNYADGEWHHITCVYNINADELLAYRNGELIDTTDVSSMGQFNLTNSVALSLGARGSGNNALSAHADDFRFYNRAVTAEEIKQLYNLGAGSKMGATATEEDDNLVLHYTFDGPDMINNVTDVSGEGNHGGLDLGSTGNTATTVTPGVIGQALTLDGEDDEVFISDNWRTHFAEDFSVSGWFKLDPSIYDEGHNSLWGTYDGYGDEDVRCMLFISGSPACYVHEDGVGGGGGMEEVSRWYHLVFTRNTNGTIKIYIDGELKNSSTAVTGTLSLTGNDVFVLGQHGVADNFVGNIDDFRVYDKVLSAEEVRNLYSMSGNKISSTNQGITNGLIAHYTFDGSDMINNVTDVSGEGNHGGLDLGSTGNTATTVTPGVIGQALTFDGEDDEVFISDNWRTHFAEDFSVAGWFRIEDGLEDVGTGVFSTYDGRAGNSVTCGVNLYNYWLGCHAEESVSSGHYSIDTGKWHHFTFIRDNDGVLELYLDGEFYDSATSAGGTYSLTTNDVFRLGPNANINLKGNMDDFRVYNRVLSDEEIKSLYSMGNP